MWQCNVCGQVNESGSRCRGCGSSPGAPLGSQIGGPRPMSPEREAASRAYVGRPVQTYALTGLVHQRGCTATWSTNPARCSECGAS